MNAPPRLPWPELFVGGVTVLLALGIYLWAHRDQPALAASKDAGAEIVRALEAERAAAGEYPRALDDLVPAHLATVPAPEWGVQRWSYRAYGAGGDTTGAVPRHFFRLSVAGDPSGYPLLFYDLTEKRWVLNN